MPPEYIQVDDTAHLLRTVPDERDPRGIVWVFEPPRPQSTYVMGVDASVGITGWHRSLRTSEDTGTDNGAIEIIRVGNPEREEPDVQVAEYAAPIDPYELAGVANTLGRLYGGAQDDGQALAIVEVYPGPGMITMREMIDRYGYLNHFVWKYRDDMTIKLTSALGWYASVKSVRDLWILGTRHLCRDLARIHSPWLTEEFADCERDPVKQTGKAIYGSHDDRVRAFLMALWAAHDWTGQVELVPTRNVTTDRTPNWQASDISYDQMMELWDDILSLDW